MGIGKILGYTVGGAVLGVGAVAAAPFTGGGSILGAISLATSLAGAGAIAVGSAVVAGGAGAYGSQQAHPAGPQQPARHHAEQCDAAGHVAQMGGAPADRGTWAAAAGQ